MSTTENTIQQNTERSTSEVHTETAHSGPEIPTVSGEVIGSIAGISITTTILSTWLFMIALGSLILWFARSLQKNAGSRVASVGIDLVGRLDAMAIGLLGNKATARRYFPLVAGFFVFIFFANLFGLLLDIFNLAFPFGHAYFRPINADLNTTLIMGGTIILVAQASGVAVKGFVKHYGHYLFNWSGHSGAEKVVNVFVGWLHLFGEFIRIGSLSLRLFLNIFVGAILIGVAVYVGKMIPSFHTGIGQFITLPFFFFELLVAFLQAYIFMTLSSLYLREAIEIPHH